MLTLKGLIIGFTLAAPVGPICILCFQRVLQQSWRAGIYTGLGVALVDSCYGFIGMLGVASLTDFIERWKLIFTIVSAIYLIYLGLKISRQPIMLATASEQKSNRGFLSNFSSTLLLTATNPMTILPYAALVTGFTLSTEGMTTTIPISIGIFLGSFLWWLVLTVIASISKHYIDERWMRLINLIAGTIICIMGLSVVLKQLL